jgi:hypothetical protein
MNPNAATSERFETETPAEMLVEEGSVTVEIERAETNPERGPEHIETAEPMPEETDEAETAPPPETVLDLTAFLETDPDGDLGDFTPTNLVLAPPPRHAAPKLSTVPNAPLNRLGRRVKRHETAITGGEQAA